MVRHQMKKISDESKNQLVVGQQLTFGFSFGSEQDFEHFFVGPNLQVVHALMNADVHEFSGYQLIWGPKQTGKTHLLQALCHRVEGVFKSVQGAVAYLPLRELLTVGPKVLEGMSQYPLVCLDDIDCIGGDSVWEEAIFHFFNQMKELCNRLVISSGVSPICLKINLQDLLSRLRSGEIYQLHGLDDEQKQAALCLRAELRGIAISDEVGAYILKRVARDWGTLIQLLDKIDEQSLRLKRKVTVPLVKSLISSID